MENNVNRVFSEDARVIGIVDPQTAHVVPECDQALRLIFHDIEPVLARNWKVDGNGVPYELMNEEHGQEILAFLDKHRDAPQDIVLYVHCHQGVARSGAVAEFARDHCGVDPDTFAKDNPNINPNKHVASILSQVAQRAS
jgi:predicted protein tyrosine phosphatase